MNTDRIEKKVVLKAPIERVWGAISDAGRFGSWFGMAFDAPFAEGARLAGRIMPTTVDAKVANMQKPFEGHPVEIFIERIEPMKRSRSAGILSRSNATSTIPRSRRP